MYKYLFGPVPSRRLGISLGIDIIPKKVCSLNCVYCEVGKTTKLTLDRKEYVPYDKIVAEIDDYISNNPAPDYITFSGSGEPTLNIRFGDIVKYIKKNYPQIKLAVLTNGTLLSNPQVRKEMLPADVVLPSLDAVSDESFSKIDRPNPDINMQEYIKGLSDFRKEYTGKIWLEVLILKGYNDNDSDINLLKDAIAKINPNTVQLNTLDRPGTVADLKPVTVEKLKKIAKILDFHSVEIIAKPQQRTKIKSYKDDIEAQILSTIKRRPCTLDDLKSLLGIHIAEINKYLGVLQENKLIETKELKRGVFYQYKTKSK